MTSRYGTASRRLHPQTRGPARKTNEASRAVSGLARAAVGASAGGPWVATILIVPGCLLAPISVLAVWAASEVSNTGRYVATMEPLVHNPAIQNALTDKITAEITARLKVTSYADQAAAALSARGLPKPVRCSSRCPLACQRSRRVRSQ